MLKKSLFVLFLLIQSYWAFTQSVDLLIRGGHVIDPKNGIDTVMDVAIDEGRILAVAPNLSQDSVFRVIEAKGLYVVPGLIDIHAHNFWGTRENAYLSDSYSSLPPDGFTFRAGVTTVVDAGGPGWRNFNTFKTQTIGHSKTRVLSFLNIVGAGMGGGPVEQNLADMDGVLTGLYAQEHPEHIVGIKVAHFMGRDWAPVERAVEAGTIADIPVMVDFGGSEPPLSLDTLFMHKLRPGDIFTHCFADVPGRMAIVDERRQLRPFVREAQERGIIFDVGHGGGSFLFDQAIPAFEQGFKPNSISTDLHTGSMNGGMKNMLNVMSKLLNIGLSLEEVIERSTWNPARFINRPELGQLSKGAVADVAVLSLEEGDFGFVDVRGWKLNGDQKLVCELTLREGQVVWDLNGISRPEWEK